jgi:predicted permease
MPGYGLLSDLRDATRALRRAPGETMTVFVCLVLGSTLAVLMFGLVNTILAGDVPGIQGRDRLVFVLGESATRPLRRLAGGEDRAFAARLPGLASIGVEDASWGFAVRIQDRAVTARGRHVSGAYFDTLGTRPAAGRLIGRQDDEGGAPPVAVLSRRFAVRHFGDPEAAPGRAIRIGPETFTVIGVLPQGFTGIQPAKMGEAPEDRTDVWVPLVQRRGPAAVTAAQGPTVIARLADGVSRRDAELGIQFLTAHLNAERPSTDRLTAVRLVPFHLFETNMTLAERLGGAAALLAVPFIILAIACVNVAGVYLSRAVSRTHELAIRASLGASRLRIARLLTLDTGLVALAAGLTAWAISAGALRWSASLLPVAVTADLRVLVFSVLLPVGITLVAGLWPAWRATGFDVLSGLQLGPRGGAARPRLGRTILVSQIGLSVMLLAASGYFLRTLGPDPAMVGGAQDEVLVADIRFLNLEIGEAREVSSRLAILDQAGRFPGVTTAAAGERLLSQLNGVAARQVTHGWFEAVGLRFRSGRGFRSNDADVAVVNETWAAPLGGIERAVGAEIEIRYPGRRRVNVIGVVEDGYERVAWGRHVPVAYVPMEPTRSGEFTLYLRGPAAASAKPALAALLASVDPALSPSQIGTVAELVRTHARAEVGVAGALGFMSGIAMILVAVGLFGATSASVARRAHEFGIRLALGARPGQIGARVLRDTLKVTMAGGLLGLSLSVGLLTALAPPNAPLDLLDPIPAAISLAAVAAIGLAAAAAPARRVMATDPATALRSA